MNLLMDVHFFNPLNHVGKGKLHVTLKYTLLFRARYVCSAMHMHESRHPAMSRKHGCVECTRIGHMI